MEPSLGRGWSTGSSLRAGQAPPLPPTPKLGNQDFRLPATLPSPHHSPADGGGHLPAAERKQCLRLFCAAAGRGHVVPRAGPPSPASTPRSTASCPASSFRAQRPLALHGVGTPQGPWETTEAGEAVVHTTPAPAPRGLRPRALHPAWCSPLASPSPAGVTPSAGWKKPRRSRGPRLSLWVAL